MTGDSNQDAGDVLGKKRIGIETAQVGVRIPKATAHDIDVLIKNGFYKDRSDFVYEAIKEHLEMVKGKLSGRIIELEIPVPSIDEKHDEQSRTGVKRP